jgi:hypothetical protein
MIRRLRTIAITTAAVAWLTFVVSFFLPATQAFNFIADSAPIVNGWGAFVDTFLNAPLILAFSGNPYALLLLYSPLANLLLLLAPIAFLDVRRLAAAYGIVLAACGSAILAGSCRGSGTYYVGFYTWAASFFVMSGACLLASFCAKVRDAHADAWR